MKKLKEKIENIQCIIGNFVADPINIIIALAVLESVGFIILLVLIYVLR